MAANNLHQTQDALQGSRTNRAARKEYKPKDLQHVQIWEERANEALTVLESNANVLTALKDYYLSLAENSKFPLKQTSTDDIHTFVGQVKDLIGDCNMQSVRAKLLVQIASQRKTMVCRFNGLAMSKLGTLPDRMNRSFNTFNHKPQRPWNR